MATHRNAKGTRETTRKVLSYEQGKSLDKWVVENYGACISDVDAAQQATEALGFPVSTSSVASMRDLNGIMPARPRSSGKGVILTPEEYKDFKRMWDIFSTAGAFATSSALQEMFNPNETKSERAFRVGVVKHADNHIALTKKE